MISLTKYLRKRKKNIQEILELPHHKFNVEAFHKLRVEIKKMNALLMLINSVSADFRYKKTFKPFKKIFDQSGKIREIQLEELLISNHHYSVLLKDYLSDLKNAELKEKNIFFSIKEDIINNDLKKKYVKVRHDLASAPGSQMVKYIYQYRKKIRKILSSETIEKEQAHQLRKKLKTFDYFRRIVDMEDCIPSFPKQDKLIVSLGTWHDGQVTIQHLDQCIDSACVPHAEFRPLQKLKEKIYQQNEKLLTEINNSKRP